MDQALATLREYSLESIECTGKVIGRGSYAVVLEMCYYGLRCAGKKFSTDLCGRSVGDQRVGDTIRRFAEESRLLSQLRHPNIVQFLGVYFQRGTSIPVLVMEFLPATLAQRIDKNTELGSLPNEVIYTILSDVALGVNYLHGRSPSIVHRDLSANNILLTNDLIAKIADLGVAKILHLNPFELLRMTKTPGTPCYMPPEALEDNPQYDTSIDIFSYGILLIHIFSGKWPFPTKSVTVDPNDPKKLNPVSEAKRRQQYLDDITPGHPLMDLILKCISNSPTLRPTAAKVLKDVKDVEARFSPTGKEELLQRVKALSVSIKEVEERSKSQEQHTDETKVAHKEVTSPLSSAPSSKSSDSERQDHKRTADRPQTSSPNQEDKKRGPWHGALVSMQTLYASLEVELKTAQENLDEIKAAQLTESEFYAQLEDDKEQCLGLVARIEKRRQTVESLIVDLKKAEERGKMRASKLQESLNVTQELCRSLQHFLQVQETTAKEFQETQQRLGELMEEAFLDK